MESHVAEKAPESLPEAEVTSLKSTIESLPRIEAPEEAPETRVEDFREVERAYGEEEAMAEAGRCLASRIEGCIECGDAREGARSGPSTMK